MMNLESATESRPWRVSFLECHATCCQDEEDDGWWTVVVLNILGVITQGRTLRVERSMVRDSLQLMAECCLDSDQRLPTSNPTIRDPLGNRIEKVGLRVVVGRPLRA